MELQQSTSGTYYYNKGRGAPLVLLHGFPDCAENFKHQLNYFSDKGFEVFCPFMPGYHPEDKDLSSYESIRISLEIINFVRDITKDPITLLGHDWGASAAYGVASLEPGMVENLITISVPHGSNLINAILMDGDQQRKSWYMFYFQLEIADLAVPLNDFEFIKRLWREWSPNWPEYKEYSKSTIDVLSKEGVLSRALGYYRSTFQVGLQGTELNEEQMALREKKIACPSLYLHGLNDGCIGSELAEGMEDNFDNLTIKVLEGCGHFLHIEKHQEVNDLIHEFLVSNYI